jgi:hypothetical protein
MAQQTALQFFLMGLVELEIGKGIPTDKQVELHKLFEQAKAMEKEQIINFGNDLLAQNDRSYIGFPDLAKEYYNETYNK